MASKTPPIPADNRPFSYWDQKLAELTKPRVAGEPVQYWPKSMYADLQTAAPTAADYASRSLGGVDTSGPMQGPPIPPMPTAPTAPTAPMPAPAGPSGPPQPTQGMIAAQQAFRDQENADRNGNQAAAQLDAQGYAAYRAAEQKERDLSPYEQFRRQEILQSERMQPYNPVKYRPEDFNPVQQSTVAAITPPNNQMADIQGQQRSTGADEGKLQARIDAELQRTGRPSEQEARDWGQQNQMPEGTRRELARAISDGWVDVGQIKPEAMPWDQLALEPGYQRIGQLGMKDPEAAMRYIVDLQHTASAKDLQNATASREKLSREVEKVSKDPAALLDHLVEGNWRADWLQQMAPNDPTLTEMYGRILDPMGTGTPQANMPRYAQGPFFSAALMAQTNPQTAKDLLIKEFESRNAGARGFLPSVGQGFQSMWKPQLSVPETGWQKAGALTGTLARELPLIYLAGEGATALMGETALGGAGLDALKAGEGFNTARMAAGTVHAGLTGAIRATGGEAVEALRDPSGYDLKGAPGRIAATTGEFALYGPAYQVVGAVGEAGGGYVSRVLERTNPQLADTLSKVLDHPVYQVGKKAVTAYGAGALVGGAKATGSAIIQEMHNPGSFSAKEFVQTVAEHAKTNMTQEIGAVLAYGLLHGELLGSPNSMAEQMRRANNSPYVVMLRLRGANARGTESEVAATRNEAVGKIHEYLVGQPGTAEQGNIRPLAYREMPEDAHALVSGLRGGERQFAEQYLQRLQEWNGEGQAPPPPETSVSSERAAEIAGQLRSYAREAYPVNQDVHKAFAEGRYQDLTQEQFLAAMRGQYEAQGLPWSAREAGAWAREHENLVQAVEAQKRDEERANKPGDTDTEPLVNIPLLKQGETVQFDNAKGETVTGTVKEQPSAGAKFVSVEIPADKSQKGLGGYRQGMGAFMSGTTPAAPSVVRVPTGAVRKTTDQGQTIDVQTPEEAKAQQPAAQEAKPQGAPQERPAEQPVQQEQATTPPVNQSQEIDAAGEAERERVHKTREARTAKAQELDAKYGGKYNVNNTLNDDGAEDKVTISVMGIDHHSGKARVSIEYSSGNTDFQTFTEQELADGILMHRGFVRPDETWAAPDGMPKRGETVTITKYKAHNVGTVAGYSPNGKYVLVRLPGPEGQMPQIHRVLTSEIEVKAQETNTEPPQGKTGIDPAKLVKGVRVKYTDESGQAHLGTVMASPPADLSSVLVRPDNNTKGDLTRWPLDRLELHTDVHRFTEGQRVQYTNKKGETLTGTVKRNHWEGDTHVSVQVDQIAHAGGVPILRAEEWPVDEVKSLEEAKGSQAAKPEPPKPEEAGGAKGEETKPTGEVAAVAASLRVAGVNVIRVEEKFVRTNGQENTRIFFDSKVPDDVYKVLKAHKFIHLKLDANGEPVKNKFQKGTWTFTSHYSEENATFVRDLAAEMKKEVPQAASDETPVKKPEEEPKPAQPEPTTEETKPTKTEETPKPSPEGGKPAPEGQQTGEKTDKIKLKGIPADQIDRIRRQLEDNGKATWINATVEIKHIGPDRSEVREFNITRDGQAVTIRDTNLNDERAVERAIEYLAVWSGSGRPSEHSIELSLNDMTYALFRSPNDPRADKFLMEAAARVGFESFWRDLVPTLWGEQSKFNTDVKDASDIRIRLDSYWLRKERGLGWPPEKAGGIGEGGTKEVAPDKKADQPKPEKQGESPRGQERQPLSNRLTPEEETELIRQLNDDGTATLDGVTVGLMSRMANSALVSIETEDQLLFPRMKDVNDDEPHTITVPASTHQDAVTNTINVLKVWAHRGVPTRDYVQAVSTDIWANLNGSNESAWNDTYRFEPLGFGSWPELAYTALGRDTKTDKEIPSAEELTAKLMDYYENGYQSERGGELTDGETGSMGPKDGGSSEEVSPEDVRRTEGGGKAGGRSVQGTGEGEGSTGGAPSGGNGVRPGAGDGTEGEHSPAGRGDATRSGGDDRATKSVDGPGERQPAVVKNNYTISDADELGAGGPKTKYKANVAAIRLLKQLELDGRLATPEEQAVLVKYVGWGGLPNAFNYDGEQGLLEKGQWDKEQAELRELMTPEEYKEARKSTQYAHYTSPIVVRAMYDALTALGFRGGRVLEPAMGTGNFFGLMPGAMLKASNLHGIEFDSLTARIAKQLYQKADIRQNGFQNEQFPKGFFDLVVGNPPFNDVSPHDPEYNKYNLYLHDYFFVKSLDLLRPGGILAFVTSSGTMDKNGRKARLLMGERADLLGAVRLPGDAFKQNAGTEVTTDILFFQKRAEGAPRGGESWIGTGPSNVRGKYSNGLLPVNEYYLSHPEMVLGELAEDKLYTGRLGAVATEGDLAPKLAEALAKLPRGVFQPIGPREIPQTQWEPVASPSTVKEGAFYIEGGKVYRRKGSGREEVPDERNAAGDLTPETIRRKALIPLRDGARSVLHLMTTDADDATITTAQKHLSGLYDAFVKKHGPIHDRGNLRAFAGDPDLPLLLMLEKWDSKNGKATKGDIFTKRVVQMPTAPSRAANTSDALAITLGERGQVDWTRIQNLLPDQSLEDVQRQMQTDGLVFRSPAGDWVSREEYLSGHVLQKLLEARAAAKSDDSFTLNVTELEKVVPPTVPLDKVRARIGAPWIPIREINQFVYDLYQHRGTPSVTYDYVPAAGVYTMEVNRGLVPDAMATLTWGTHRAPAHEIVLDALEGRSVKVNDQVEMADGKKRPVLNETETVAANAKLEALQDEFKAWLLRDPDRANALETKYNWLYNGWVRRQFDGSHLTLPGKAAYLYGDPFSLRLHQKNAIWRITQTPATLLWHVVGSGKTFTMIGAGMELKRMGLARKPMFAVPNNIVDQFGADFLRMYPGASILVLTSDDVSEKNRKLTTARIAGGEWDAVIVPHSSFGLIQMSNKAQQEQIDQRLKKLESLRRDLILSGTDERAKPVKKIEKKMERLTEKLKKLQASHRKDDLIDFEQLGVDALFLDEAHEYKNLEYDTIRHNVSGINSEGNQKTNDLMLKVRHLQKIGGKVIFATGTPLSNSLGEIYSFMNYLAPDMLNELGLTNFDQWANQFGEIKTQLEMKPSGHGLRQKERFNKFTNVFELFQAVQRFADIILPEMLPPEDLPRPPVLGGKPELIEVPGSEWLTSYVQWLQDLIDNAPKEEKQHISLVAATLGRKGALDRRLTERNVPPEATKDTKVTRAAKEILDMYKEHDDVKGTQLVFSDFGAPSKNARFNVYAALRDELVAGGIPAKEIAFIHDYKSDEQRAVLFDKFRSGDIRVLVGSSKKMGAGMNVQDRLVMLHHMDPPWRPLDIEQRDGRGIRQGNKLFESGRIKGVRVARYVTKGSFDGYMWQLLEQKAGFIGQMLTANDPTMREVDDLSDTVLVGAAEAKALASGNETMREKVTKTGRLNQLQALQTAYLENQRRIASELKHLPDTIRDNQARIKAIQTDAERLEDTSGDKFKIVLPEALGSDKTVTLTDRKAAGEKLAELHNAAELVLMRETGTGQVKRLGEFAGLPLYVQKAGLDKYPLILRGELDHFAYGETLPSLESTVRPDALANRIKQVKEFLQQNQAQYDQLKALADKKFEHKEELQQLRAEIAELDKKLVEEGKNRNTSVKPFDPSNLWDEKYSDRYYGPTGADDEQDGEADDGGDDVADLTTDDGDNFDEEGALTDEGDSTDLTADDGANSDESEMAKKKGKKRVVQKWPGRNLSPETVRNIADRLAKVIGVVARGTRPQSKGAEGTYNWKTTAARVRPRSFDSWRVIGHELSHALEGQTGFLGDPKEMETIANAYYPGKLTKKNIPREGKAEFFALWFTDPQRMQQEAPKTVALWETFLQAHPDLHEELSKIRALVDAELALPTIVRATMATRWNPMALMPTLRRIFVGNYAGWLERVKGWGRNLNDEVGVRLDGKPPMSRGEMYSVPWAKRPLWKIIDRAIPLADMYKEALSHGYTGVDLEKIASIGGNVLDRAKAGFDFHPRDEQGQFVTAGRPLRAIAQEAVDLIGDKLGWQAMERPDGQRMGAVHLFDAYLKARRALERYEHAKFKGPMDPETGLWMTHEEAVDTIREMEKAFPGIDGKAAEFSKTLSDIVLTKLERAGILTSKMRATVEKGSLPEFYIPIVYDETPRPVSGREQEGHAVGQPVKRFRGRAASTRDFISSTVMRLAEVEQAIRFKSLLDAVQDAIEKDGMGGFGEIEKRPIEAIKISMQEINDRLEKLIGAPLPFAQLGVQAMTFFRAGQLNTREPVMVNIRNGQPVFIRLAPDVFESMAAMEPIARDVWAKVLGGFSRGTRLAGLLRLPTMMNIFFRDLWTLTQQGHKGWGRNVGESMATILKAVVQDNLRHVGFAVGLPDELYQLYVESGGYGGSFASILAGLKGSGSASVLHTNAPGLLRVVRGAKQSFAFVVRTPVEALRFLEEYPRMAEWMAVFKQEVDKLQAGVTGDEALELVKKGLISQLPQKIQNELERIFVDAAYASHEATVNAARTGSSKFVRQYMPTVAFLQGQLQGPYRFYRHWRDNPGQALRRQGWMIFLAALAWAWRMQSDEEEKQYYAELPQDVRDMYWIVQVPGTGAHLWIAKPYEHALIVNTMDRFLDWGLLHEKGKAPLQSWTRMVVRSLTPNQVANQFLMGLVHLYAGVDDYGSPIVPRSEQDLATYQSAGPSTSPFAIELAKIQAKVLNDPHAGFKARQIDYALRNVIPWGAMTASVGNVLAALANDKKAGVLDLLRAAVSAKNDQKIAGVEYAPVIGPLLHGEAESGSTKVDRFYQDRAKAMKWHATVKEASDKHTGIPIGMDENAVRLVAALPAMDAIVSELSTVRGQLQHDMQAATPEKRKELLMRYNYIQRLATERLYGQSPVPPKEANLQPETIQRLTDYFDGVISKAMANSANRQGGPDEVAAAMAKALAAQKKGRP